RPVVYTNPKHNAVGELEGYMIQGFSPELPAAERIVLAVDTKEELKAAQLMRTAVHAGASTVKLGLELMMATSPKACSELAESFGLNWVADFKIKDIPNTVAGAVESIVA